MKQDEYAYALTLEMEKGTGRLCAWYRFGYKGETYGQFLVVPLPASLEEINSAFLAL